MRRGLGHPTRPDSPRPPSRSSAGKETLTVTELTRRIKSLLEGSVGAVAVEGEISGLKASPSGHVYFALKDAGALIDCVIWRSTAQRLPAPPPDGARVTARGRLGVYEPRGRYQLVVTSLSGDAGKGDLWQKFEETKARLAAEGLFAPERKIPLPEQPRTIGIVTSPTGAALRDMLKILTRRAPNVKIVVSPALVQGRDAAPDIAGALERLDRWGGADVIIVGRGGGSIEDLWPFNEEAVARAIASVRAPVVSAVGHETDFTIADFVADARAATPSEAAERIAPDLSQLRGGIAHASVALSRALSGVIRERRECLRGLSRSRVYRRPLDLFMPKWQRLDDTFARFAMAMESVLGRSRARQELAATRMAAISPLKVLERGYAVVLDGGGRALLDAEGVGPGDRVTAILHRGRLEAEVTATRSGDTP